VHQKKDRSLEFIVAKIFKACAKGHRLCLSLNAWLEWWSIWSNCLPSSELSCVPPGPCHSVVMPSNRALILSKATVQQGWGHGTQVDFLPDTFCLLCGRWIGPKVLHGLVWHSTEWLWFLSAQLLDMVWEVNWLNWKKKCELTSFYLSWWCKVPLRLAFKQNVFLSA